MSWVRDSKVLVSSVRKEGFGDPFDNRTTYKIDLHANCVEGAAVHSVLDVLTEVHRALGERLTACEPVLEHMGALMMCARHVPWQQQKGRLEHDDDDDEMPFGMQHMFRSTVRAEGEVVHLLLGRPVLPCGTALQQMQMLRAELDNGGGSTLLVRALLFEPRPKLSAASMLVETFVNAGAGLVSIPSAGRKRFVKAAGLIPVGVLPVRRGATHAERNSRGRSDHRQFLRSIGCGQLFSVRHSSRELVGDSVLWRTRACVDGTAFEVMSVFVPTTWA